MPEWWTYGLADAQIFSARAYDALVERCLHAAWPAQPLATGVGLAVLALLWRRPPWGARALAAGAALACATVALGWLPRCYAELHWAAGWLAGGFGLQALLLAAAAVVPGALPRAGERGPRGGAMVLLAVAVVAWPWLALPAGAGPWRAEVVGLMPAPTLVAGLAVVPLAATRWRLVLLPLPIAGVAVEAVTLGSIGRAQWVLLPLVTLVLLALLWRLHGAVRRHCTRERLLPLVRQGWRRGMLARRARDEDRSRL
jgi:hypothetical protein